MSGQRPLWTHERLDEGKFERTKFWTLATLNARLSGQRQLWTHKCLNKDKIWTKECLDNSNLDRLNVWTKENYLNTRKTGRRQTHERPDKGNCEHMTDWTKASLNAQMSGKRQIWKHECLDKGNFERLNVWIKATLNAQITITNLIGLEIVWSFSDHTIPYPLIVSIGNCWNRYIVTVIIIVALLWNNGNFTPFEIVLDSCP